MDSRRKKLTVSYAISLSAISIVLILSFVVLFGRSVAWFSNNEQVKAEGMSIDVLYDDSLNIQKITIYKVENENISATKHENPVGDQLETLLELNEYDAVFEEKREHIPIILKVTLENFKSGSQAAQVKATVSLGEETGYTLMDGEEQRLLPFISNFVQIYCSADAALSDTDKGAGAYYVSARDHFLDNVTPKTFVDYTDGEPVNITNKQSTITFDLIKPAGQTTLDVYMLLRYDERLIERFIDDSNRGVSDAGQLEDYIKWGANVNFAEDLDMILFTEVTE